MVQIFGLLFVVAAVAAVFFAMQAGAARVAAGLANQELERLRERLTAATADAKKNAEAIDGRRKEIDDLKEKLKDVKKKRFDEKEASKQKRDADLIREEVEREIEPKLGLLRDEAEAAKRELKRATAELDALRTKAVQSAAPVSAPSSAAAQTPIEPAVRELSVEEKARLETAEKNLAKAKAKIEELEAETKKARGRSETDRRVFLVQKGETEVAKDRYRALEARYNELTLDRDGLRKALWELEKEVRALGGKEVAAAAHVGPVADELRDESDLIARASESKAMDPAPPPESKDSNDPTGEADANGAGGAAVAHPAIAASELSQSAAVKA